MRNTFFLVALVALAACDSFDPRPECSWALDVVDAQTGEVALYNPNDFACQDAETTPNSVMYELVMVGGEPVAEPDTDVICDSGNLYVALEVEALPEAAYVPWTEEPGGSIVLDFPARKVQGGWYAVTFLENLPDGSMVSKDPWTGYFQLGVADSELERDACREH